jgi:hypothetical protein
MTRFLCGSLSSLLLLTSCAPPAGSEPESSSLPADAEVLASQDGAVTSCPTGNFRCANVSIPEQGTGVLLAGRVYAPTQTTAGGPFPLIGLLPGGGATLDSVEWAATRLVGSGYVVVSVTPQSGTQTGSYNLALKSALDFMSSGGNPFLSVTDGARVGAAGWSPSRRPRRRTPASTPSSHGTTWPFVPRGTRVPPRRAGPA